LRSAGTATEGQVEIVAALLSPRRNDAALEAIIGKLCLHRLVFDAKWRAGNPVEARS
jgi:hypothetical protein